MSTSATPTRNVEQDLGSSPTSTGRLEGDLLSHAAEPQAAGQRPGTAGRARHFLRHFGEMFLAMVVGMMVLGMFDRAILAIAGTNVDTVREQAPEAVALVMAINMTAGMTVWMRHRRHTWAMCAEMAGAMFVPAVAAIVLFWCSVIHSGSVGAVEMTAMLPAMIAVMLLRRSEYSQPVHSHARETAALVYPPAG
jgi:hypothetical protein